MDKIYKDEDWLQEHYCEQGLIAEECAVLARCGKSTILVWLEKYGILRRTKSELNVIRYNRIHKSYKDKSWLLEHYCKQKLSVQECGELAGCNGATITNWLKKHGIPRRTRSETTAMAWMRGAYDGNAEKLKAAWDRGVYNAQGDRVKADWARGVYDAHSKVLEAARRRGAFAHMYTEEWRQKISAGVKAARARGAYDTMFTEEVRQKLSDVRRAAWEQGLYDQCFRSPTTIEIAISEALDKLNIEHIRQYRPDGCSYIYDEYLPLLGILLEVNGDYWHTREGVPEKDARKAAWAIGREFQPVTIWESEIKEHGALAMVQNRVLAK